jgi:hypothetical protein
MGFYPFNPNLVGDRQQTDAGLLIDRCHLAHYRVASPLAAVANHYVVSGDMKVGAYALANDRPGDGSARSVVATRTVVDTADTAGTLVITGTDLAGNVITETINVGANGIAVPTARAFATVTSIVGAGWVIGGTDEDTIVVGFGNLVGLPDLLPHNTVLAVCLNNVREAVAPTVTCSTTVLALNTVTLASALVNAQPIDVYYIV